MCKMTREIQLCIDYHKLNPMVEHDTFPLSHIDEALQAVHKCQWFMLFTGLQGYPQMPMDKAGIKRWHSEQDPLAFMSLLICHFACLTLE